jgi:hypothetical protein
MGGTNRQLNTTKEAPSLTRRTTDSEARRGFRAIGVAVSKLARPIVAKRGGGILVRLKAEWAAIVGVDWAEVTWPTALSRDGVLRLRAISSAALELQHRAPLMIERLNLFFGRPVVTRLIFVQGPLPLAATPTAPYIGQLAPREERALDEQLSEITDPELRNALAKLGRAVSGRGH